MTNPDIFQQYFDLLEPSQIYNCDDSGMPLEHKLPRVVSLKGTKKVRQKSARILTSSESLALLEAKKQQKEEDEKEKERKKKEREEKRIAKESEKKQKQQERESKKAEQARKKEELARKKERGASKEKRPTEERC